MPVIAQKSFGSSDDQVARKNSYGTVIGYIQIVAARKDMHRQKERVATYLLKSFFVVRKFSRQLSRDRFHRIPCLFAVRQTVTCALAYFVPNLDLGTGTTVAWY